MAERNHACSESYDWLEEQKDKEWKSIAHKLYSEKKYDWCLWLLYQKTMKAKLILWLLIILSYLCSGILIYISINYNNNVFAVVVAVVVAIAIAGAVAFAIAGAVAFAFAGAFAFAIAGAVAVAFAIAGAVAFAIAGAVAFAGAFAGADIITKIICYICLRCYKKQGATIS